MSSIYHQFLSLNSTSFGNNANFYQLVDPFYCWFQFLYFIWKQNQSVFLFLVFFKRNQILSP